LGQKFQRLSCRVLEDGVSLDFSSQIELYLWAFFCHLLRQSNQKKKVSGRHFGRCSGGRSLHSLSPGDKNARTELSVQPKTEFQIKFK